MGILDSVIGLGTSVLNNHLAAKEAEKERKWSAQQAQINREFQTSERLASQEFNLDMWNRQNAYNDPSAQLQRLMAAGINPSMAFGGSANTTAGSIPSSMPQSGVMPQNSTIAGSIASNSAALGNMLAQTRYLDSQTKLNTQEYTFNELTQEQRFHLLKQEYERNKVEIDKMLKEMGIMDVEKQSIENTMLWYSKLSEAQIMQITEQLNLLRVQTSHEGEKMKNTIEERSIIEANVEGQNILNEGYKLDNEGKKLDNEGKKLSNEEAQIRIDFSRVTGAPVGTGEFELMFSLWKRGELESFLSGIATKAVSSVGGAAIGFGLGKVGGLFRGAKSLWKKAKGLFNPKFGKGKVRGNTIEWSN